MIQISSQHVPEYTVPLGAAEMVAIEREVAFRIRRRWHQLKVLLCQCAVTLSVVSGSGCAYTRHVAQAGWTEAQIHYGDAFMDQEGNVYVESELERKRKNAESGGKPLGRRFFVLNAPGFQKEAERLIAARLDGGFSLENLEVTVQIRGDVPLIQDHKDARDAVGWYLFPGDVTNFYKSPELPAHLHESTWSKLSAEHRRWYSDVLQIEIEEETISVHMRFNDATKYDRDTRWGPAVRRALFVPATLLDIITFPIQLVQFHIELSAYR